MVFAVAVVETKTLALQRMLLNGNRLRALSSCYGSGFSTVVLENCCRLARPSMQQCFPRQTTLYQAVSIRLFTSNYASADGGMKSCWSCGKSLDRKQNRFFCQPCNVVQAPDKSMDYFELFELPTSYKIDKAALTKYRNTLQRQLHPDHFQGKSEQEQQLSREQSSFVNNAYNVLTNPFSRGDYLLGLVGAGRIDENSLQGEVEFLSVVMELNEEIAENSTSPERLHQLKKNNEQKLEQLESRVTAAFDSNNISEARLLLCKMQYYNNISEKLKDALMRVELRPKM